MKKILLISCLLLQTVFGYSQVTYTFAAASGTFNSNTTPTVIFASGIDDQISAAIPIGFNFVYGCDSYSQFVASSNGWIGFGTASFFSEAFNTLSTTTSRPKIAPLWDDLATGATGNVNYKLTGTSPNQVLTIEWKEMEWRYTATDWALSFQVKLHETSNLIEFIYIRNGNANANLDFPDASIGLATATAGSFYSLDGTSNAPAVSTVTETSNISTKPANGQTYRWTNTSVFCIGTPIGGTASASVATTTCTNLSSTLTATGQSTGCGLAYQWQSSPNGSTWTNIAGANSSTTTVTNSATTQYRLVTTCSGSGISANGTPVTVNFSGISPVNDLPCNATNLTLGVSASGTTECAGNASEPAAPACWFNGSINSVWYTIQAPASGQLKIRTILLSSGTILQNTQIAVYSGTCSSMTYVNCNNDAVSCGSYTPLNSELILTGLTSGATYFIVVDGYNSLGGSFEILAIDGTQNYPTIAGQDCPVSFPVCNSTMTIGNPGYQSIGGQCDNTGTATSECTSGEANAVWYSFQIGSTGTLAFDIIPNDYGNPNPITGQANPSYTSTGSETDYDWVLWKVSGAGSTTCSAIMSSGGNGSSACNFNGLGVTGCTASGNSPPAYGVGFDGAYEIGPNVVNGEQYVLAIHNFSNSSSGFTLQFPGTSPVVYLPTTTLYWTGGANTTVATNSNNWGGCGIPTCGLNAVVTGASSFQPVLIAGTYDVNTITISTGSTLTLQAGATLNVCGDFINNGNLICMPGSTVVFVGTGTQNITGSFVGADGFANLTINKSTGLVIANNNIDVKENFLTNNATSIFNSNEKIIRVAGNFTNNNGNATYTTTGTLGVLEFFGTGSQIYNQGSTQLDLNKVIMNHTGTNVVLATNMFIKSVSGTLTLTLGKIQTGTFRVDVNNSDPTSVTTGNANSYVFGNLYRTLNGAANSYDFPLGTASLYQRANINFTSTTTIPRLMSRFDLWGTPPNHINGISDCSTTYNLLSENNGFWTINATANHTSGTYSTTLYCNSATNTAGAMGWTVEKSQDLGTTWILSGTCDPTSTATIVKRNAMNGFSLFAAAQATVPLPVEMKSFYGFSLGRENELHWITESEYNSNYFEIQKSKNGVDFTTLTQIDAVGTSSSEINYSFVDQNPFFPITYYRLKQVDDNGQNTLSSILQIETKPSTQLDIYQIYPNPTSGDCVVEIYQEKKEEIEVTVTDMNGIVLLKKQLEAATSSVLSLNSSDWNAGVYFIRLTTVSGETSSARFIKK